MPVKKIKLFKVILVVVASVWAKVALAIDASDYSPPMQCFLDATKCGYLVDKRVWVRPIKLEKVSICPVDYWQRSTREPDPCKYVRSGSFTIKAIRKQSEYTYDFLVKLDNGNNALVDKSNVLSLSLVDPVAAATAIREECERRGQPKIGMIPTEAAETCWGKPRRIVKLTTAEGTREDYVYGTGRTLRFENGKLTAIIETK
jgi:hypothetical protein